MFYTFKNQSEAEKFMCSTDLLVEQCCVCACVCVNGLMISLEDKAAAKFVESP